MRDGVFVNVLASLGRSYGAERVRNTDVPLAPKNMYKKSLVRGEVNILASEVINVDTAADTDCWVISFLIHNETFWVCAISLCHLNFAEPIVIFHHSE